MVRVRAVAPEWGANFTEPIGKAFLCVRGASGRVQTWRLAGQTRITTQAGDAQTTKLMQ